MKEQKNESKEKLITAILYAAAAVAFGILALTEVISQEGIQSLIHIGLIFVFGGLAMENYRKYRKDKDK